MREKTVYVFIDDLDRCEVPKAAELMQALNLMMSTDRKGLIFIIGMDREKVAAGLAVKNEKLLPYLYASKMGQNADANRIDPQLGLAFGYNFIEKFIQIPFLVPSPAPENVERFFDKLAKAEAEPRRRPYLKVVREEIGIFLLGQQRKMLRALNERSIAKEKQASTQGAAFDTMAPVPNVAPATAKRRENLKLMVAGDSATVRKIVLSVAPVLGNNPRRLKQFVNLFRLRTFIAAETGLFDGERGLTLQQLGKFVALNLRWPLLLLDLERYPGLLDVLTRVSALPGYEGPLTDVTPKLLDVSNRWRDPSLMDLLKSRMMPTQEAIETSSNDPSVGASSGPASWSLEGVDVRNLLRVSPRVRTIAFDEAAKAQPRTVPQSQTEIPPVKVSTSETVAAAASGASAETTSDPKDDHIDNRRSIALIADPGDFREVERLQTSLQSRGIKAIALEGRLAGSNLVVKLAPDRGISTVLFCLGASAIMAAKTPEAISHAIGDDRIPVILESIEGGDLNSIFHGRIFFDIREPGEWEKLVAYLEHGTFVRPPDLRVSAV
jgi:hypothetical protein